MKTSYNAFMLTQLIEQQAPPLAIQQQTEMVIVELGGNPNVISTSPGAAALYILALALRP